MRRYLPVLFVLLLVPCGVFAGATDQSVLSCTPLEVEPNEKVTCTIFVRDVVQEPTTLFSPSDFSIVATPSILQTSLSVSTLVVGDDITTAVFTISAASGTKIALKVFLRASGTEIRGSGVVLSVLVWPATRVGPIRCSTDNFVNGRLPLRASTICSADVSGNNDLPAAVHGSDVFFAEDHFAGTFLYLSGAKQLVFNFTASSAVASNFDQFLIRVTISSSDAVYTVAIPMAYPLLPATTASTLQCTSSASTTSCYIYSRDRLGPVAFVATQFNILFERLDGGDTVAAWVPSTTDMNLTVSSVDGQGSVGKVSWVLAINNRISTQRLHINIGAVDVTSSPFVFTAGIAPLPNNVVFRSCVLQYVASGNTTVCTLDLLNGATGDPSYYTLSSSLGAKLTDLTYVAQDAQYKVPVMTFTYNAPQVSMRSEDALGVTVSQQPVTNSPYRLIIYAVTAVVTEESSGQGVPGMIAIGLIFYGTALGYGLYMFVERQKRMVKVQNARLEHEKKQEAEQLEKSMAAQQQQQQQQAVLEATVAHPREKEAAPLPPPMGTSVTSQPRMGTSLDLSNVQPHLTNIVNLGNNNNNNNLLLTGGEPQVEYKDLHRDEDSDDD